MNIADNVSKFIGGNNRQLTGSESSFDFCFNHFQSFRRMGNIDAIAANENIELSCLHLGFYLASWGMFRKGDLKRKSTKHYQPLIEELVAFDRAIWDIDIPDYPEDEKIALLHQFGKKIATWLPQKSESDILKTKIMLGVFGNVPAFDTYFSQGILGIKDKLLDFSSKSLKKVFDFFDAHKVEIDSYRIPTLDFKTGQPTEILYPRAKIIDMVFWVEGGGLLSYEAPPQSNSKIEGQGNN